MSRFKLINLHNSTKATPPPIDSTNEDCLQYGEIAVNYAQGSETLYIRNTNDEAIKFLNSNYFRYGCTNLTSLTEIPINTRLVYATISSNETLSIDTESFSDVFSEFPNGIKMKIIAYNKTPNNITLTFPWTEENYICFVKQLTINSGEYGVINIDFKSETEIFINAEVKQQSSYSGEYGIVAFSNGSDYWLVKDKDNNLSDFKTTHSDYEPIGILIIPASCSNIIYSEGDVRRGKNIIMSLAAMSYSTPDTGSINNQSMYWSGTYDVGLPKFNVVNSYVNIDEQTDLSTSGATIMCSDGFSAKQCRLCPTLGYAYSSGFLVSPPPFKSVDGELIPNEEYYSTEYSTQNAFSDFAGPYNTKTIIDKATAQIDWKTKGVVITNSYAEGYYPIACCCARFGAPDNSSVPKGTSSFLYHEENNTDYDYSKGVVGVWYLPSFGELCYYMPNRTKDDNTIKKVGALYPNVKCSALVNSIIWSSTESSQDGARILYSYSGYIPSNSKTRDGVCRAFCAI